MQFGIFTVGDITTDPATGKAPSEHQRIKNTVEMAVLAEQTRFTLENHGWSVLTPGIDTRGAVLTS